jgi:Rps23 Pro-64 3,4-dihydroxylase Tpa1-like proline 4-hydroxylase
MANPMHASGEPIPLFEVNPALDRKALAAKFARERRIQVRDVLTERTAREIRRILSDETPWGISWQAGSASRPQHLRPQQLAQMSPQQRANMSESLGRAISTDEYAFLYAAYPMVDSVLEKWDPGNPLDLILEHINDEPFLELLRDVSGIPELVKADGQATLYQPGHFLSQHSDSHKDEGWRVAYVLNFTKGDWRPDWGGYLLFYDEDGNVISGYRPRFNSLNMFAVPQWHSVTYVAPFAPVGRYAITGWARDR